MINENFTLESRLLEVASFANYKEATFLISVLDEPDAYGRIIPEDAGEKYADTIVGFPIVAKLKKNIFGKPYDFGGHEVYEVKGENGKKVKRFGTTPIGSVLSAWIEERELENYDEPKKCILCKAKLWSSRFPEYFKVFDKLWKKGNIASSWELTATEVEEKDGFKIYKVFEFISNCLLGMSKTPAVSGAGVIEYAELEEDLNTELADALEKDITNLDINYAEKEELNLAGKEKKEKENIDKPTKGAEPIVDTPKDDGEKKKKSSEEKAECKKKKVKTAEDEGNAEIASLTENDLFRIINEECRKAIGCSWGYISYWFPEEHTVWFKPCGNELQLEYKLFTYSVEGDEVEVSEPTDVTLTVSVDKINEEIAEKNEKIQTLTAELELKNEAVISAGEKIGKLKVEISELEPYKQKVELAEKEKIEAEIAEEKKSLKNDLMKTKLFTEDEIAEAEIAELIEARDKTAINNLIANRYIASLNNTQVAENKNEEITFVASLETDDIEDNPSEFMRNLLRRK